MSEVIKDTPIKDTKKGALGRGLGSLLGDDVFSERASSKAAATGGAMPTQAQPIADVPAPTAPQAATVAHDIDDKSRIWQVDVERLVPNQFQPRKEFSAERIQELAASIKEKGILQPILARRAGDRYEIIAGERRWRAAQAAGLHRVPVILSEAKNQESLELALIENIQRHDLNAIEEAEAYDQLMNEFSLTQAEVALKVGKERATVANTLRLLGLPLEVRSMVVSGELSVGHAKALLAIQDPVRQRELAKKINSEKLTVRAAEKIIQTTEKKRGPAHDLEKLDVAQQLVDGLCEDLRKALGTKIQIQYAKGRGQIQIAFYSDDDLNRIIERIKR